MVEIKQLWEDVLSEIETNVSKANFTTWFKNTDIAKQESGVVYLSVPNAFVKDWLFNKYHKLILKCLRELSQGVRRVDYVVSKDLVAGKKEFIHKTQILQPDMVVNELPLNDLYINQKDNLNPRYVFESFVIGPFNELANAAAQQVTRNPGTAYNPLFIHGSTGLGKTHLIQSIGNFLKNQSPELKIYYLTSEKFTVDYVNAVQNNRANDFKEKYRKYDVFIMDDIQFLSKKKGTQEELFHLFNTLYELNKQIIFSSDQHPNFIPDLEDRLRSRFSQGMIVDISQPEYEARLAILKHKCLEKQFSPQDKTLEYLAATIQGNIRELEGLLNTLICQSQLKKRDLDESEVKTLIKNNLKPKRIASVKEVVGIVAGFYNIEERSVYEKTRKREIVKPRQIVMYILREDFSVSYPTIGSKLGGRDHTTVMHSCEKVRNDLKNSTTLFQEIEQIRSLL